MSLLNNCTDLAFKFLSSVEIDNYVVINMNYMELEHLKIYLVIINNDYKVL